MQSVSAKQLGFRQTPSGQVKPDLQSELTSQEPLQETNVIPGVEVEVGVEVGVGVVVEVGVGVAVGEPVVVAVGVGVVVSRLKESTGQAWVDVVGVVVGVVVGTGTQISSIISTKACAQVWGLGR